MSVSGKFQSTPSVGRETPPQGNTGGEGEFQSTPSVGRETIAQELGFTGIGNFNPLPPWGGRQELRQGRCVRDNFNPLPPWGGRRTTAIDFSTVIRISIHSLRGEGDRCSCNGVRSREHFNPLPPWGGRLRAIVIPLYISLFQSTPSVGRETLHLQKAV